MTTMTNTIDKAQQTNRTGEKRIIVELFEVFSLWAIAATTVLIISINVWA